ncbi:MAG: SMC-Scp complex subunit ScpB [Actinomycetota bacterium]|nr:SMC-Scp complex subunit ScpB [Actinomycetota bacterium]
MEASPLIGAIEALLFVATDPIAVEDLARYLDVTKDEIEGELDNLATSLKEEGRGVELLKIAGGYRLYTKSVYEPYLRRFAEDTSNSRLSGASLETLAIVAYQQPISRSRVATIRGVNSDAVMRLLAVKGYIAPLGKERGPNSAQLFGTTKYFLEIMGLNSLEDLPRLIEFAPPTEMAEALENTLRDEA